MNKIMDKVEEHDDYRLRVEKITSVYQTQYDSSANKFETVQAFITIRDEIKKQNKQFREYLRNELEDFRNAKTVAGDYWLELIEEAYFYTGFGEILKKEFQDKTIELTSELFNDQNVISKVRSTLEGCTWLAESEIKKTHLNLLIETIIDNNYPSSLNDTDFKNSPFNSGKMTIRGPRQSKVQNIIHEMALKRGGPDKRSKYKYEDVYDALMKRYDNPGLRHEDLNTPIIENTFSAMWKALLKKIDEVNVSEPN